MAKKDRRKKSKNDSATASAIPYRLSLPKVSGVLKRPVLSHEIRQVEDRRTHHPLGRARPARMVSGVTAKTLKPKIKRGPHGRPLRSARLPHTLAFAAPKKVLVCVRRGIRKAVLHALGRTGKGSTSHKKSRSYYSGVSCK